MRWIPLPLAISMALAATAGLAADSVLRPEQMREAMGLELGEWQTTSRLVDVQVEPRPGGDRAEADRYADSLRVKVGKVRTQRQCLWAKRDGLNLPGLYPPEGCAYGRMEASEGRFAMESTCSRSQPGETLRVSVEGTYASDRMAYRSDATASAKGGFVRIKLEAQSRFTGTCAPGPVIRAPPAKGN